jgi:hypothetical protein
MEPQLQGGELYKYQEGKGMKYLVTFDYDPADIPELAKKAKVYDEDKKKTQTSIQIQSSQPTS